MKASRLLLGGILLTALSLAWFLLNAGGEKAYLGQLAKKRKEKDREFKASPASPLTDSLKFSFTGLAYFNPDRSYKINARLEPLPSHEVMELPMNNGRQEQYLKFGYAIFELQDQPCKLLLLRKIGDKKNRLFLAFGDRTNGKLTYGGGRYIDLDYGDTGRIVIDFNLAYHPFCVYSDGYVCPLPPRENFLPFEVRAGEKLSP